MFAGDQGARLFQWRQVSPLEILHQRHLELLVVCKTFTDGRRYGRQSRHLCSPPSSLTDDQKVTIRAILTDEQRLENAVAPNRFRQRLEGPLIKSVPWLVGVRVELLDRNLGKPSTRPGCFGNERPEAATERLFCGHAFPIRSRYSLPSCKYACEPRLRRSYA